MDLQKRFLTCEEFQVATLGVDGLGQKNVLAPEAREHLLICADCAAFWSNWLGVRHDLHGLGSEDQNVGASSRVEMRLRQEFRTKYKAMKLQRRAVVAAWALAAAAVLVTALGWVRWSENRNMPIAEVQSPARQMASQNGTTNTGGRKVAPAGPELGEVLVASNNAEEFTLLPGAMPGFLGDATVVHVKMQRSALGALGLTVNEEKAGDWIDVDLVLSDDGQPQAVRLPENTN